MTITASNGRPRAPLHDFSPAAIMARANGVAADSAARHAGKSKTVTDLRSPDDLMAEIRATITGQLGAPLPPLTSALAGRRAIFGAFDGETTRG